MARIVTALAHELIARGAIDIREAFIDASFAPLKKAARLEKRNAATGQRSWRSLIATDYQFLFVSRVPLPMK
jgi:hypothetical protein